MKERGMLAIAIVYAVGWTLAYVLSRRGSVSDKDGWSYPSWLLATLWPVLVIIAAFIGTVLGFVWLDEALKREGV